MKLNCYIGKQYFISMIYNCTQLTFSKHNIMLMTNEVIKVVH